MRMRDSTKNQLKDNAAIEACAREFGVVGGKTRLKVCYLLCHAKEMSVGEMAETIDTSVSAVSRALKKLAEAGVLKRRREFRHVYYTFTKTPLAKLVKTRLS